MPITRQVKNVVKNYSNVEVKVREATSNDPWGPSSSLMADIADQTYNVVAFSEIMTMIWKRLNDHGKNWRHVYKSLVLLDYILKTGSERVAQQCRENMFAVQTLKDFQFIDRDGKDQGMNVREKSKQLVALLKDDERLKNERTRALKAKERLSQSVGGVGRKEIVGGSSTLRESGSASDVRVEKASEATEPTSRSWEPERRTYKSEIEKCRPSNTNEEELQLQLALALSKQEADETKQKLDKDEQRFQMAVTESRQSVKKPAQNSLLNIAGQADPWGGAPPTQPPPPASDPWGNQPADPWGGPSAAPPAAPPTDPWNSSSNLPQNTTWSPMTSTTNTTVPPQADPWGAPPAAQPAPDPWVGASNPTPPQAADPWAAPAPQEPWNQPTTVSGDLFSTPANPWSGPTQATSNGGSTVTEPFEMSSIGQSLQPDNSPKQTDLLANHSTLVNLDSLVGTNKQSNPFFTPTPQPTKPGNPFAQDKPLAPSLNQLRTNVPQPVQPNPNVFGDPLLPAPLIPAGSSSGADSAKNNPFL